jgi:hypothetical protein
LNEDASAGLRASRKHRGKNDRVRQFHRSDGSSHIEIESIERARMLLRDQARC